LQNIRGGKPLAVFVFVLVFLVSIGLVKTYCALMLLVGQQERHLACKN